MSFSAGERCGVGWGRGGGQFWKSGIYKLYMSKTLLLGTAGAEVIVPSIENPELSMVLSKLT